MNRPHSHTIHCPSPIGVIAVTGTDEGITAIDFVNNDSGGTGDGAPDMVSECVRQLHEYFRGERQAFSLLLAPFGTEFEQKVWRELKGIPFGETRSYGDIARALGDINAVRAVGRANGRNPLAIVIPCHRVIGGDGSLTGYAGGIERKRWLLDHEGRVSGARLL